MPIKLIDLRTSPGFFVSVCACCGVEHRVNLDRGAVETRPGPFVLSAGMVLELRVDDGAPVTLPFVIGEFPDFGAVTPEQLRDHLNARLVGATASLDGAMVLIESDRTGVDSRIETIAGTACTALGLSKGGLRDPCSGRPVLGHSAGGGTVNKDLIVLRRCHCGGNEVLVRRWDAADPRLAGSAIYEQRRAVNALAQHLKKQEAIHPDAAAAIAAEAGAPVDLLAEVAEREVIPPMPRRPTERGGA